ncbi:alpha/beta hydrolase [Microbacterium sp. NPDC077184]|uniref:alpha/beta fold hydrolase n=1 Tax=Microbacterium sp. NPDC077184 TaxID=3154764 RepID=UPI0034389923
MTEAADPAWVLLHGTPLTPGIWDDVATALPGGVRTPDTSVVPEADAVHALAEEVAASLPEAGCHLVGHSFGGQIALEVALSAPERVRSVTILCSRDTPFPAFAPLSDAVRAGRVPDPSASLARWFTAAELTENGAAVRRARAALAAATADPTSWANALAAIATFDRSADVGRLQVPLALHAAGTDGVSTPEAMRALERRVPGAILTVHPGWAHMSPFAEADRLAGLLRRGVQRWRMG